MLENAQEALRAASIDANASSLGVLMLAVLSLHGRVVRALATLPDVTGDDVPWAEIGDRDLYVSAVSGALTVQRGRIAALSDLRDRSGLLESCRLSLQTLAAVVRDVEGIFPTPLPPQRGPDRPKAGSDRASCSLLAPGGTLRLRVISA